MAEENSSNRVNRRAVLRSTAAVATSGALLPTVSAKRNGNSDKEAFDAAIRVFEATGDTEKFTKVLENRGMEDATKERQWQVPAAPVADESAGGISTQTLDSNDFSLFMSIAHSSNSGRIQVFSNWTHEVTYSLWDNEAGEKPNDIAGFGFAEADYLLDDWQSSEYVDRTEYSASGIAFEYCDSR